MPKIKLDHTSALLAQCEPGKKKTDYWDTGETCSGLVLELPELEPGDSKSTTHGTIGPIDEMPDRVRICIKN